MTSKKVCYLPGRESGYIRTKAIRESLREAQIDFFDCSHPAKRLIRYFISFFKFLKCVRKSDVIFVGFCGHILVFLVRLVTRKPIVFDVYISIFETLTLERKRFSKTSLLGKLCRFLDHKSCQYSQLVIFDTIAHMDYFQKEFSIDRNKMHRLIASCGSVPPISLPRETKLTPLIVHYSEFQSLHGVDIILRAAKEIPNGEFRIIGKGICWKNCLALAKTLELTNIEFVGFLPYKKLLEYIAQADICLGIFGGTPKSFLVIPNKIYDYLAMGKVTITQRSPAVEELFEDGQDLVLCEPQNPHALSSKIQLLLESPFLRKRIAQQGKKSFEEKCSTQILAAELKQILSTIR